jgi:leader peptidase (prepilin peptidase) / N-methyltransferase
MILLYQTVVVGLLGLAFGSFLNVCLTRWPEGESIVRPASHCRSCGRSLKWWENIPLLSWVALRCRCRTCHAWIGWRYPLVEASVAILWASAAWESLSTDPLHESPVAFALMHLAFLGLIVFFWLLIALAVLDAEHLWLPDWLTWPGIVLGFIDALLVKWIAIFTYSPSNCEKQLISAAGNQLLAIFAAALLILLIRWTYKLIRKREGIGLGDAKLMAMLAAWLGLSGALLSFFIGVALGSVAALIVLANPASRAKESNWALTKLPLGTFLCVGGIVSALWGQPILAAYLRWAGF